MRVLLVKLSSLGDVVHTLPVVQDILAAMPDAQIDWVVEKAFAPLLTQIKGLHRIIPCDLRRWRKSVWAAQTRGEWRAFKVDLQTTHYDAVIDLQGLTKSAVVARLARLAVGGKRYAMANQTDGSGYEAPTRWLADVAIAVEPHSHAVARARFVVAKALAYQLSIAKTTAAKTNPAIAHPTITNPTITNPTIANPTIANPTEITPTYGLKTPLAAIKIAQAAPKKIAFIHGTSRRDKTWPTQHWLELGQRFATLGYQLVLVHGNASELLISQAIAARLGCNCVVLPLLSLAELTQELAACHGAIGVDSGVSHIAVALGLPHVQIYNFDTAWRTGPLGQVNQRSVFAQPSPTVDAVWQA